MLGTLPCSGEVLTTEERDDGCPGLFFVSPPLEDFGEEEGDDGGGATMSLVAVLRPLPSLDTLLYFICTWVVPSRSFPLRKSGRSSSWWVG